MLWKLYVTSSTEPPGRVLSEVRKMLPAVLLAKLPTAQTEFEMRSKKVWGTYTVGLATTPIPDGYSQ